MSCHGVWGVCQHGKTKTHDRNGLKVTFGTVVVLNTLSNSIDFGWLGGALSAQKTKSINRNIILKYTRTHHYTKVRGEIKRNKWKSNFKNL